MIVNRKPSPLVVEMSEEEADLILSTLYSVAPSHSAQGQLIDAICRPLEKFVSKRTWKATSRIYLVLKDPTPM